MANKKLFIFLNSLWLDITDRGAHNKKVGTNTKEVLSYLLLIVASIVTITKQVKEFLGEIIGIYSFLIPTIILLLFLFLSMLGIFGKERISTNQDGDGHRKEYLQPNFVRQLCKLWFIMLLVGLLVSFSNALDDIKVYPNPISGYVYDLDSREPVRHAVLQILTNRNVNTSNSWWISDDSGYFCISLNESIRRSYKMSIYSKGPQATIDTFNLSSAEKFHSDNDKPIFTFYIRTK